MLENESKCNNVTFRTQNSPFNMWYYSIIIMFNIKHLLMHNVQMHKCAISCLVYGLCVCTSDNPLTEARGISSRTDARTIHQVTRKGTLYDMTRKTITWLHVMEWRFFFCFVLFCFVVFFLFFFCLFFLCFFFCCCCFFIMWIEYLKW